MSRLFCLSQAWVFREYDGCESGVRGCGWGGGVGVVEKVWRRGGVRGVGVGGAGNRQGVVSSVGNVSVAGRGARWRDCCSFPNGIFIGLWEDLPCHLPFAFDINDVFL